MASEDTKYPKIRISPEAKAILDKGKTSPSKKIDEWLGINKTETPQKVYENPETHLLDHAIILALFETSKTDNLVKREAKMWETLLEGGTEHFIREEVLGNFTNNVKSNTGEYLSWAKVYPHFFDKDTSNKNAKTTFAIAVHNRLKSLEKMGITATYNDGKLARWKLRPEYITQGTLGYDQIISYLTECWRVTPSNLNTVEKLDIKTYEPIADSEEPLIQAKLLFNKTIEVIQKLQAEMIEEANKIVQIEGQPKGVPIQIDTSKFKLIKQELGKYGVIADYSITINEDDEVDSLKKTLEKIDRGEAGFGEVGFYTRDNIEEQIRKIESKPHVKAKLIYSPDGKNEEVLAEVDSKDLEDKEAKGFDEIWESSKNQ